MTTAKKIKCPECGMTKFTSTQMLGLHRKNVHGVESEVPSTVYAKLKYQADRGELVKTIDPKNPLQCQICGLPIRSKSGLSLHINRNHPKPATPVEIPVEIPAAVEVKPVSNGKRKYIRREIEQPAQAHATIIVSEAQEGHPATNGYAIPDGTLALALGRFQGLCQSMAVEFDLPPRLFAARLAELIYHAQVR
jgi:uncharacterized C2H2 Zn-finger protein